MDRSSKKFPLLILFVAVVALLGMKDTGVFLKPFSAPIAGEELSFEEGRKATIKSEDEQFYYITEEDMDVKVPKNVMIKTIVDGQYLKAIKPTKLYSEIGGDIIRIVLSDEVVEILATEGDYYKIKASEGVSGYILAADVTITEAQFRTDAVSMTNKFLVNNELLYELQEGLSVEVVDYVNGEFVLIDENGQLFHALKDDVKLNLPEIVVPESIEEDSINVDDVVSEETVSEPQEIVDKIKEIEPNAPYAEGADELGKIDFIINYAMQQLDRPYVYADSGKAGYDCSGLLYDLYVNQLGISIPRSSYDQVEAGIPVRRDELKPGDLIFFNTTGTDNSHVGMYIGNDEFIHASSGSGKVVITELSTDYYNERYSTARRIIY